jgi:crotonobetainyl-CoA:carnitine CoA-transferase CaiB-like acyl-CoA transferase
MCVLMFRYACFKYDSFIQLTVSEKYKTNQYSFSVFPIWSSNQDGDPVRPGVAMTDLATGLFAYGAIMAGLLQRYRTGKGLFIDCNLLSSQVLIYLTF